VAKVKNKPKLITEIAFLAKIL